MKFACILSETKVNVENQLVQMGKVLLLQQVTLSYWTLHTQLVDFAQSEPRIEFLRYNKYFISLTREANLGNSLSVVQWKLLPSGP